MKLRALIVTVALGTCAVPVLAQDIVVRGVVRGPERIPVPFAELLVGDSTRAYSDSVGAFSMSGLRAGPVELIVRRVGFSPISIPLTLVAGQRRTLAIELAPLAYAIDPVLIRDVHRPAIFGQVVDADGNPIAGAEVRVAGTGRIDTTGSDGAFSFSGLTAGTHLVSARARGRYAARFTVVLPPDRGRELRLELGLVDSAVTRGAADVASGYFWRESVPLRDLDRRLRANREVLLPRAVLAREGSAAIRDVVARAPSLASSLDASARGVRSIDPRGTQSTQGNPLLNIDATDGGTCWFVDGLPPLSVVIAQNMPAEWVESVEIVRNETTGTLKTWLPPLANCKRYVVVWTRK